MYSNLTIHEFCFTEAMFAIVQWLDTIEVSAVPSNWLVTGDAGCLWCYWPSKAGGVNAFKKRAEPNPQWHKYRVQDLGRAGTSYMLLTFPF